MHKGIFILNKLVFNLTIMLFYNFILTKGGDNVNICSKEKNMFNSINELQNIVDGLAKDPVDKKILKLQNMIIGMEDLSYHKPECLTIFLSLVSVSKVVDIELITREMLKVGNIVDLIEYSFQATVTIGAYSAVLLIRKELIKIGDVGDIVRFEKFGKVSGIDEVVTFVFANCSMENIKKFVEESDGYSLNEYRLDIEMVHRFVKKKYNEIVNKSEYDILKSRYEDLETKYNELLEKNPGINQDNKIEEQNDNVSDGL